MHIEENTTLHLQIFILLVSKHTTVKPPPVHKNRWLTLSKGFLDHMQQ